MNSRQRLIVAIVLTILILSVDQAFAQVVGGGGGGTGLMGPVIAWVVTNILAPLLGVAVLYFGSTMLFGRHVLANIIIGIVGGLVIANYQAIAGYFNIGG